MSYFITYMEHVGYNYTACHNKVLLFKAILLNWPVNRKEIKTIPMLLSKNPSPSWALNNAFYFPCRKNSGFQTDARRRERELKRNRRMTLVLSCIGIIFAISWLPYHLYLILTDIFSLVRVNWGKAISKFSRARWLNTVVTKLGSSDTILFMLM